MKPIRIAVTGSNGLLGRAICRCGTTSGHEMVPVTRLEWNLAEQCQAVALLDRIRPQVVIHCAAITNVDWCENSPQEAMTINASATKALAEAAARAGVKMVYISSCGIFDGRKRVPYVENDLPAPMTAYARSKHEGEKLMLAAQPSGLVCRVGWLFGGERNQPRNFVEARRKEALLKKQLVSANDKWGSPTWVDHAGQRILELSNLPVEGIVHVANSGVASRFEYVRAIINNLRVDATVKPADSSQFKRLAPVPDYEALSSLRLGAIDLPPLPPWQIAMHEYISTEYA